MKKKILKGKIYRILSVPFFPYRFHYFIKYDASEAHNILLGDTDDQITIEQHHAEKRTKPIPGRNGMVPASAIATNTSKITILFAPAFAGRPPLGGQNGILKIHFLEVSTGGLGHPPVAVLAGGLCYSQRQQN